MSKEAHDTFTLVVNFLWKKWMPKHITIDLFDTFETLEQVLARNVQDLL
jgi:hypothetical protein